MKINEDEAHLRVEIGSGGQMTAQIEPKRKIDVLIGDAAKMDCQRAITYIKSGTEEIDKAAQKGIEKIEQKVEGMADVDLSNLSSLGRAKFDAKQDVISDLATIRAGAAFGATAVQPADLATVALSGDYDDLSGTPTLASVATSGSYNDLSNKPTIPAAQVNSDWNAVSGVAQILNKPTFATVALSGAYSDLNGTPDLSGYANADLSNVSATGKSTLSEFGFPSNTHIDETYTSSYTAPANGYLYIAGAAISNGGIVALTNTSASFGVQSSGAHSVGYGVYCTIPCKKADIISVYVAQVNISTFRFVYAQGEI